MRFSYHSGMYGTPPGLTIHGPQGDRRARSAIEANRVHTELMRVPKGVEREELTEHYYHLFNQQAEEPTL